MPVDPPHVLIGPHTSAPEQTVSCFFLSRKLSRGHRPLPCLPTLSNSPTREPPTTPPTPPNQPPRIPSPRPAPLPTLPPSKGRHRTTHDGVPSRGTLCYFIFCDLPAQPSASSQRLDHHPASQPVMPPQTPPQTNPSATANPTTPKPTPPIRRFHACREPHRVADQPANPCATNPPTTLPPANPPTTVPSVDLARSAPPSAPPCRRR